MTCIKTKNKIVTFSDLKVAPNVVALIKPQVLAATKEFIKKVGCVPFFVVDSDCRVVCDVLVYLALRELKKEQNYAGLGLMAPQLVYFADELHENGELEFAALMCSLPIMDFQKYKSTEALENEKDTV